MIENAAQLYSNARQSGNNMLLNDIDMAGENWPIAFSQRAFTGKFYGNGYKIYNISANQQSNFRLDSYGLFGSISAAAEFKDITFENVSYHVSGALSNASFGLFAGQVADGALFDNVTISNGKLILTEELISEVTMSINLKNGIFEIGQLFGYGTANINAVNVSCELAVDNANVQLSVSPSGEITVTFSE